MSGPTATILPRKRKARAFSFLLKFESSEAGALRYGRLQDNVGTIKPTRFRWKSKNICYWAMRVVNSWFTSVGCFAICEWLCLSNYLSAERFTTATAALRRVQLGQNDRKEGQLLLFSYVSKIAPTRFKIKNSLTRFDLTKINFYLIIVGI